MLFLFVCFFVLLPFFGVSLNKIHHDIERSIECNIFHNAVQKKPHVAAIWTIHWNFDDFFLFQYTMDKFIIIAYSRKTCRLVMLKGLFFRALAVFFIMEWSTFAFHALNNLSEMFLFCPHSIILNICLFLQSAHWLIVNDCGQMKSACHFECDTITNYFHIYHSHTHTKKKLTQTWLNEHENTLKKTGFSFILNHNKNTF